MAAPKWKVFKEDRLLGLYSAKQIREALRSGAIDPFDLVCQENSQIKLRLVEVDEIFATAEDGEEAAKTSSDLSFSEPKAPIAIERPAERAQPYADQTAFPNEPSRRDYSRHRASASTKNAKKFFVKDKHNRVLGPLSANEVQSLFYRGILANNVRVQKSGESKSISINTFIASYSGERVQEIANSDGSRRKSTPGLQNLSSAALNEFYKGMSTKDLTQNRYVRVGVLAFVGILLGFLLYSVLHKKLPSGDDARDVSREEETTSGGRSKPRLRYSKQAIEDDAEVATPRRRVQRPSPEKKEPRPKPAVARPRKEVAATPPKPSPRTQPARKPSPAPATPKAAPRAASSGSARSLASQVGQVIQFGPAIFSKNVLDSCALKCEVKFQNESKEQVKAVFFKAGYYNQLKAASGRVILTGRLSKEGSGYVMFLQNVVETP
ncbi:MAG: hypothetical protein AB7T49_13620 [Oligoflexales bacterium]